MMPASLLTYRSQLYHLEAFKLIKRNSPGHEIQYNLCLYGFNYLFCCKANDHYDDYLEVRHDKKDDYSLVALQFKMPVIIAMFFFQYYRSAFSHTYELPEFYLPLLLLLEL